MKSQTDFKNLNNRPTKKPRTRSDDPLLLGSHKIQIHRISNLCFHKKDGEKGFRLWKDLFERGFALLQVDFSPVRFSQIDGRFSEGRTHKSGCELEESEGRKNYNYKRSLKTPSKLVNVVDDEFKSVLDSNFEKLLTTSSEVCTEVSGMNLSSNIRRYQKAVQNALQSTQSKIITSASDLSSKTSSRGRILANLYKDMETLRKKQGYLKRFIGCDGAKAHEILSKYPPDQDERNPDLLSVTKYTGGGMKEQVTSGLLTLVFQERPNPLIAGGLEVRTNDGAWYEVENDICNKANVCVVIPGHQMELLSQGFIPATTHRVKQCFGTSTSFSFFASESALRDKMHSVNVDLNQVQSSILDHDLSTSKNEVPQDGFGKLATSTAQSSCEDNIEFLENCDEDNTKLILEPPQFFFKIIVAHNASIEDYWATRDSPTQSSEDSSLSDEEDFVYYEHQQDTETSFPVLEVKSMPL